jgi:tetratricopeptide (TPR) repeat protein
MNAVQRAQLVMLASLVACAHDPTPKKVAAVKVSEDRDPALLFDRGKAFAQVGDAIRAEQYLSAAITYGADERLVTPVLLKACVMARHYRLAIEYADAALARHPNDAKLRFLAGALHKDVGEPIRAREYLEQAAHELKDDAEVQFAVAVFLRDDIQDRNAADPYFREYLRLSPEGSHAEEARVSLMVRVR